MWFLRCCGLFLRVTKLKCTGWFLECCYVVSKVLWVVFCRLLNWSIMGGC